MNSFEDREYEQLLRDGITAVKNGNHSMGRRLLEKAAAYHRADAQPWIWLAETTQDAQERRKFLEYAVAADPANAAARRNLAMLSEKMDKDRVVEIGESIEPRRPVEPESATGQAFTCPQCGSTLHFNPDKDVLECAHCGYAETYLPGSSKTESPPADTAEQVMDYVLPTTRAHRWAEAQHRLSCGQCGAVTLLPVGQQTSQCPYCGSNQLVESAEQVELVDPQVIGLLQIGGQKAIQNAQKWLSQGMLAPDDLGKVAQNLQLRPAYYPFWTFDGILEVPWHCEVNRGTSRNPNWVPCSGTEFEIFDDVLVPGLMGITPEQQAALEPFSLKQVDDFDPKLLAGWLALSYDCPLAEASLRAREKVMAKLRSELYSRVEPGHEKRNLSSGGGKWSAQTFKLALLPLYVGAYRYGNRAYPVLINGQTGKVAGEKPRDRLKLYLVVASLLLTLFVISMILLLILK